MCYIKDIISIDKESANKQQAKRIGTKYQSYYIFKTKEK